MRLSTAFIALSVIPELILQVVLVQNRVNTVFEPGPQTRKNHPGAWKLSPVSYLAVWYPDSRKGPGSLQHIEPFGILDSASKHVLRADELMRNDNLTNRN
jgi:hypothetical protein